jgi:hypothetical protein
MHVLLAMGEVVVVVLADDGSAAVARTISSIEHNANIDGHDVRGDVCVCNLNSPSPNEQMRVE